MTTNANQNPNTNREYKIYIRSTKEWVPVAEEVYRIYYRDIWAARKRAQSHGQCCCPKNKAWVCDGDCGLCEYRTTGDTACATLPKTARRYTMFAITEGTRNVYGKEITTYSREIYSANVLEVEAGTNGYQGGDSGHGSRAYIRIEDMGSTDICVHPLGRDGDEGFELFLGGDCELETMIMALKFITKALEDGTKGVHD